MCKIVEDLREEARVEGREEGREEERNALAIKLLKSGKHSVPEIAELTSLSVEEVENLKKKLDSDK